MTKKEFDVILKEQLDKTKSMLASKGTEYAGEEEDRLITFKTAAALKRETPAQALLGMMAKHTVSIYDMVRSGREYPAELWDEKITDHINYLILLSAVVKE